MENRRGTDGIKNLRGLVQVLGKYRYALIVLLVGAALMLLPSGRKPSETKAVTAPMQAEIPDVAAVQSELAALLSRVEGAGEVAVMLSLDYGPERFFRPTSKKPPTASEASGQARRSCTMKAARSGCPSSQKRGAPSIRAP